MQEEEVLIMNWFISVKMLELVHLQPLLEKFGQTKNLMILALLPASKYRDN